MFRDTVGLFYDAEAGHFMDEGGYLIFSIFDYIRPSDLFLFKRDQEYMIVPHVSLPMVACELYWPTEDEEYDYET